MSKRLLFNNTTKQIVDTNCPLCNHSQEECQCTVVDKLYIDWADAGRYANATACSTSSSYKTSGAYQYVTVYEFSTTTTNAQLFTERMTELGYVSTDNNGGSDYYGLYVSVDKKTYYYWNYTLNGSPNKTLLNKLLTLDDVYFEQLKQYGKYFEICDVCGNGVNNCTCYNVYEFTLTSSATITLNTDRRGDTTAWDKYTDWGDGKSDTSSSHSYSAGTYIVKTKYGLSSTSGSINSYTKQYLTNVLNINNNMTTLVYMFYQCTNLTSVDLSNFNASKVTAINYMFSGCTNLAYVNLSNWNTSNVTSMNNVFYQCTNLASINLSNFVTSNVTSMNGMFRSCKSLTTLDLSSFDTSKVTDMNYMFHTCSKLESLDLSNFNVANVKQVDYMFQDCKALTSLDLSNWQMISSCSYYNWFKNCSSLKKANVITTNTSSTLQKAVSSLS